MTIRAADFVTWTLKLHIFVAPVGVIGIKDHRELNEDGRVPDFTLKPAPGIGNMLYPRVFHIFNSRGDKIAEVISICFGFGSYLAIYMYILNKDHGPYD